ncbi:MAG: hypothetical protein HY791_23745 [Deltaproteobacteria bacterium]|nr:hypothetical protein [Deltaproteobacteria bacterium]
MSDTEEKAEGEQIPSDVLVVPQELTGPGVNTPTGWKSEDDKVTPQDLTSPGTQPDFRAPQAFVSTQLVRPRKGSTAGIEVDSKSRPIEAQRALLSELNESRKFFRRAASAMAIVATVASMGVVALAVMLNRATVELSALREQISRMDEHRAASREPRDDPPPREAKEQPDPSDEPEAPAREAALPEGLTAGREEAERPPRHVADENREPKRRAARPSKVKEEAPSTPRSVPEETRPPPQQGPHAALDRMLSKLRAAPGDGATFDALSKALKSAAASLPEERRRAVLSAVNAAELSYDTEGLARALSVLKSGS